MADKEAIKLYIEEQRRYHDELTAANIAVRTKTVSYIGALLAFLAFLYSGALDANKSAAERLFIPDELYGKIFYFFGLFLVLYALGKLVHSSRPNGTWTVAVASKDTEAIEEMSEEAYLLKLKDDYESARQDNVRQYTAHWSAFKDAFYPLLLGVIILIVLRYFQ
jgi:hypothetical protein